MRLKVQIGEHKLLVPVPDDKDQTVEWLMKHVAHRLQQKLKSSEPLNIQEISLDGYSLCSDDTLEGLVKDDDTLIAVTSSVPSQSVDSTASNSNTEAVTSPSAAPSSSPSSAPTSSDQAPSTSSQSNDVKEVAVAFVQEVHNIAKQIAEEPVLFCIQCGSEYRESANPEGSCSWHTEGTNGGWNSRTICCQQRTGWSGRGFLEQYVQGCKRGKHRATHHEDYPYRNYRVFTSEVLNHAKSFLEIDSKDYNDNKSGFTKSITIAEHEKKLIVAFLINNKATYIRAYATPKDIAAKEVGDATLGWFQSVKPTIDNNNGEITLEVSVKCCSATVPDTYKLHIGYDTNAQTWSLVKSEQTSNSKVEYDKTKTYELPPAQFSGKRIHPSLFEKPVEPRTFQATGDLPVLLKIEDGKKVEPYQAYFGTNCQLFTAPLVIVHESDAITNIMSVKADIFIKGQWVPAKARLGLNYWGQTTFQDTLPLTLEGKGSAGLITAEITCDFEKDWVYQGEKNNVGARWCHLNLGNPARMRYTLVSADGKSKTLEMEHVNPPLATIPKKDGRFFSLECYNTETLYFFNVQFNKVSGEHWLEYRSCGNMKMYSSDIINMWAWEAKNANSEVFELKGLAVNSSDGKGTINVYALVDLTIPRVYGFKVVINTTSGHAEDSFQFWEEQPADTRVSSVIKPIAWTPEYVYEPEEPTKNTN